MNVHFLLPARFRPFHNGHYSLLQSLLKTGFVTVVIGWANILNDKSPIMSFEVRAMINNSLKNHRLRICQMPYFDDDDSRSFSEFLSRFTKENHDNYLVSGNDLVINAVKKHSQGLKIANPYDFVLEDFKNISGTLVRQKIVQDNDSYIENIPNGTLQILQKNDLLRRIKNIHQKNIRLKLDDPQSFSIKIIDSTGKDTYLPFPNYDKFLDDFVIEHLANSGYILLPDSQTICGDLKAVGLEHDGKQYNYTFLVSDTTYTWSL